jgi:antibiotic biosynthesis monooxygenase (ABM) superfamily enzyme
MSIVLEPILLTSKTENLSTFIGLDSYIRIWDIKTRQLLSAVCSYPLLLWIVVESSWQKKGLK